MNKYRLLLNYGSIAGVLAFLLFLVYEAMGWSPLGAVSWLSAWIPVVFIPLGIKKYRDNVKEGYIKYGQALGAGLIVSFVYGSLFAMLIYLYGSFVDASFFDMYLQEAVESLKLTKDLMEKFGGEEAYSQATRELKELTVGDLAWGDLQSKLLGGLIISLIAAGFLKKQPPFGLETKEEEKEEV